MVAYYPLPCVYSMSEETPVWARMKRQNTRYCEYCGVFMTRSKRTIDHKFPKQMGGEYTKDNIAICCRSCNQLKGGEIQAETFKALLKSMSKEDIQAMKDEYRLDMRTGCKNKRGRNKTKHRRSV